MGGCCGGISCLPTSGARPVVRSLREAAQAAQPAQPRLLEAKQHSVEGWRVLEAVLRVEERCADPALQLVSTGVDEVPTEADVAEAHTVPTAAVVPEAHAEAGAEEELVAELLLDEAGARYCLCSSQDSSLVVGYFRVRHDDLYIDDVWHAMANTEERRARDPGSEYRLLKSATPEDPTREEVVHYVMKPPWPFWDRDVLHRRWQLPLDEETLGIALVMRSVQDDELLPENEERVRAFLHEGACLLRPLGRASGDPGVEVVVCQRLDLGGSCPHWAQSFITRYAVQSALHWSEALAVHCLAMREKRRQQGHEVGDAWKEGGLAASSSEVPEIESGPSPQNLLSGVLELEGVCLAGHSVGNLVIQRLLEEEERKYFLCSSLESPTLVGLLCAKLEVEVGDIWSALTDCDERVTRDPISEYRELTQPASGDPSREQALSYVLRVPRPFWDRDVLVRRWQLPVDDHGVAILLTSFDDEKLLPRRDDRVRAHVHQCGYLVRPVAGGGAWVHVIQQVDMGGLVPPWAQSWMTRALVQRGLEWAESLQSHAQAMQQKRAAEGRPVGDRWQCS